MKPCHFKGEDGDVNVPYRSELLIFLQMSPSFELDFPTQSSAPGMALKAKTQGGLVLK
jgi:hypothetical protein